MLPLAKNITRNPLVKQALIVLMAIVFSISAGVVAFMYHKKDVVINDNGEYYTIKTMKNTVGEVLKQSGINVEEYDYIDVGFETNLHRMKPNKINIKRAVPVNLIVDNEEKQIMTCKDTVAEVLADNNITLLEADRLEEVDLEDKIIKGMDISIVRVSTEIIVEDLNVPFKVEKRANARMNKGIEKVVREGKEGVRKKEYKVVFENGIQVLKELISDTLVASPVDRLVEYGTMLTHNTARGGEIRYSKVLDMKATAYTASFECTGKHPDHPQFGITYTGVRAKRGIVAVDPKVIPLGTRLYVEIAGSTPDYGYAVAADIGGGVKGNIIDLYLDTPQEVKAWGVKKAKVYILED